MTATITETNIEELVNLDDHILCDVKGCDADAEWNVNHGVAVCRFLLCERHKEFVEMITGMFKATGKNYKCSGCGAKTIRPEEVKYYRL